MIKDLFYSFLITFLGLSLVLPISTLGQVRSSTNYQIERDSLNVSGGLGESANYKVQDTVGEVSTGDSSSTNYQLSAGYQQALEESYISISSPSDLNMSAINGLTGGSSQSSVGWNITTNNNAGYSLSIKASTSPALKSALDQFDDYTTATANPDFNFSIAADKAEFGFTPSGTHIVNRFKDNGSTACNEGTSDTANRCWDSFSTVEKTVAQSNSSNHPSGSTTTIDFRAESGSNRILTAGNYSATITMTALAL